MRKARLFIVEDHAAVRQGYASFFGMMPDLEIVGEAVSAEEALVMVEAARPDLVVVDVSLPGMSGIELVARLTEMEPTVHALVVSGHDERMYAENAALVGALGYVMKSAGPGRLLSAIREALAGLDAHPVEVNHS
jgi:two-component system, NarL family, invasion response regulator UvrY